MIRDKGIREPGRVPRLLVVEAVFGNRSPMTALTRCARIMHRRALATTRTKALCIWRVFRNKQGGTHGGTVTYTTGGRGQMPMG